MPEDHLKKEAIARFYQGCTDEDAAKHACFEQPETMEEALNLVKHHQYISQAVAGKKTKREHKASVNVVQTPSARVEQLIASALRNLAAKLQESCTTSSSSSSSETEEKAKKKKSSSQCLVLLHPREKKKLKRRKVPVCVSFVKKLEILRKIAESIKHGLVKSKRVSQKTRRAIPAKNSKKDGTPGLLKKLTGHVAYQFVSSDGRLDKTAVKKKYKYTSW